MFIFIGNDQVIETEKVISILDAHLLKSSTKLNKIIAKKSKQKAVHGNQASAKSIIVTENDIYYSSLSIITLKKREELYSTIDQLESY